MPEVPGELSTSHATRVMDGKNITANVDARSVPEEGSVQVVLQVGNQSLHATTEATGTPQLSLVPSAIPGPVIVQRLEYCTAAGIHSGVHSFRQISAQGIKNRVHPRHQLLFNRGCNLTVKCCSAISHDQVLEMLASNGLDTPGFVIQTVTVTLG